MKVRLKLISVLFLTITTRIAHADEYDQVKVLEDPLFSRTHRFSMDLGFSNMPLDAYYKPIFLEASGNYQFNDLFSWDFLRAGYALYRYGTGLESDIQNQTGYTFSRPPIFKKARFYVASDASLNLFYGKLNMLNESIIYTQIALEAGPMYMDFSRKKQLGVNAGLKLQFFVNDQWSVNVKANHTIGFLSGAPSNILILNAGVGFAF